MKIQKFLSRYLILVALMASACAPLAAEDQLATTQEQLPTAELSVITVEPGAATESVPQPQPTGWDMEIVAQGLEIPWSIVFPSENRILVSERTGAIREISDGTLDTNPVYVFDEVRSTGEAGLMGLALHPQYETTPYIYACYTAADTDGSLVTRVSRLLDNGSSLSFDRIILDNIPAASNHAGCRIKFGPDNMLYITTGDALNKALPQNLNSLAGKILRITPDGDIPADNPFQDAPVYSYGHRNPQGITWDVENNRMYATEHGPSGFDGPPGGDEINLITAGGNYGWPLGSHDNVPDGTIGPLIQFTPAEAPASALFYTDNALPFFTGSLFFGALRGEGLVQVIFTKTEGGVSINTVEKIVDNVGRVRDVVAGPDGSLYFTTSNRDGRGTVLEGDDKIFRIYPIFE